MLRRLFLCGLVALTLIGCATSPRLVDHSFDFDGWRDGWYSGPQSNVQLLEYSYGDQYHMVRRKPGPGESDVPPGTSVSGPMPVGEFLYVRWRLRDSGEIVEYRVDLRERLPKNMHDQRLTFVIDGRQLYVYIVTDRAKPYGTPPVTKAWRSQMYVTYEIFPTPHKFNKE